MAKVLGMLCPSATLLLFNALISTSVYAETINYCHDEEVNQQWEQLASNNSEPEYKELYRLRKDLCAQIDNGEIELDDAIDIFEETRQEKIKILRERQQRLQNSIPLRG